MIIIEILHQQHEQIKEISDRLLLIVDQRDFSKKPIEIIRNLEMLTHIIEIHMDVEDNKLYPYLRKNKSESIKLLAKRYVEEMGKIYGEYVDFIQKWNSKKQISDKPQMFQQDIRNILNKISRRIIKEEKVLFPEVNQ